MKPRKMPTTNNSTTMPNPSAGRPRRGRRRSTPEYPSQPRPATSLLMENVKIIKRGEPLAAFLPERSDLSSTKDLETSAASSRSAGGDLSLGSSNRLGQDPQTVRKELPIAIPGKAFGTGVFVTSPHPSLVPVPWFLNGAARGGAENATHGLRRLLGAGLA